MTTTNNNNERDSYLKFSLLKKGKYDVWASEMAAHDLSINGQGWRIIMVGDEKINMKVGEKREENPLALYEEADFKVLEKNFKALKFIMSGLGPSNKRKVLSSKTVKEKWDALEKIHQGFVNVNRDRIVSLMQDYDNLRMKDKDEIEDF